MALASTVAGLAASLEEAVFDLRRCAPLTWQGSAAEEFAARIGEAEAQVRTVIDGVGRLAHLIHAHERHMALMRMVSGS